jgi:hypothetical protein
MVEIESGTHQVASGLSLVSVEVAFREIDGAAVVIDECLEFLSHLTAGESRYAVTDAQIALARIREIVDEARGHAARPDAGAM